MLIEVNDLSKCYKTNLSLIKSKEDKKNALNGVNFYIEENEIVGLVGESGCGKSTLTRQLLKLESPNEGKILYFGEDINIYSRKELKNYRRNCQLIFQNTLAALNPSLKVIDILMEPLDNHYKLSSEEKKEKIYSMLTLVELTEEILYRYPYSLSGGERQRINICRALLLKPKLLICDEIVSSLDVYIQTSIISLLKKLNKELNMSILFISHDIEVVKGLCTRILVMNNGEIVDTMNNKDEGMKIMHPYTKKLFDACPIKHPDKRN